LRRIAGASTLVAVVSLVFMVAGAAAGNGKAVYDAIPKTLPPNVASLGFEATSTKEFGDYVHLGGKERGLQTVTVTLSDWALYSDYASDPRYMGNSQTWTHPITVNVYANHLDGNGVPDRRITTVAQNITIPWRPAHDPTCPGAAWKAADGSCYNGIASNATFDFSAQNVTLPNDVIIGVAYNTADYGAAPIHQPGPYNSLNVGIATDQAVYAGSDDNADNVYWDTTYPGYTPGFRQDTVWAPNGTVNLRVNASPVDLKLDKESISDKACKPKGAKVTQVVDVTYKLLNDLDSGFAGNNWANDTIDRHLRIWDEGNGTYCAQIEDHGKFTTFAGDSPSSFSTVSAGIKGDIEGGYITSNIAGSFTTSAFPAKGNLGTFDLNTQSPPSWASYFAPGYTADAFSAWGWIYKAGQNGTWLNALGVSKETSGDIAG
jgi:hypothetical protein